MVMKRMLAASFLTIVVGAVASAQDGPLRRVGQALDRTGKNIRARVETEVVRGEVAAAERDVLKRVMRRIEWDKRFVGATIQVESRAGGVVVLRGSVANPAAKLQAAEMVQNTIGVASVVDELAVVKETKVITAAPPAEVIEVKPPVAAETKVIVKPRSDD
jgi:osmotically-inducible protein OsmY